ncbi:hypothetical protein CVO_04680 [Sulfurimonas sp. CVO]|uniref:hypothetical protein n=1 Tax=Sulfurimonas sp. CVO TaxID=2283483 RepID=UPI00132EA091|nr:hypothetical protein [Sulfurimonas sp. CVO]QHG91176.1 hypothetical protein CVO_04680 [Sulfurimonas sp. CVO]
MHIIKAKLFGVFISSDFTKEDGTVVPGKPKLQLLEEVTLKNGEKKSELLDISIPKEKLNLYKDKIGSTVEVAVGVIGKCSYYGI